MSYSFTRDRTAELRGDGEQVNKLKDLHCSTHVHALTFYFFKSPSKCMIGIMQMKLRQLSAIITKNPLIGGMDLLKTTHMK